MVVGATLSPRSSRRFVLWKILRLLGEQDGDPVDDSVRLARLPADEATIVNFEGAVADGAAQECQEIGGDGALLGGTSGVCLGHGGPFTANRGDPCRQFTFQPRVLAYDDPILAAGSSIGNWIWPPGGLYSLLWLSAEDGNCRQGLRMPSGTPHAVGGPGSTIAGRGRGQEVEG